MASMDNIALPKVPVENVVVTKSARNIVITAGSTIVTFMQQKIYKDTSSLDISINAMDYVPDSVT